MPDTMKKLGLVYSELKKHNPGLIMVRMPAFGLDGKYHRYRSWGQHVEGVAGHSWLKGYRDTDISQRPESNQSDSGAAYSAVLAVLMAIRHRNLTGEGQLIEIPLCENFIPSLAAPIIDYTMNGRVRSSLGNGHTSMAPHGVYRCKGPDSWVCDFRWERCRVGRAVPGPGQPRVDPGEAIPHRPRQVEQAGRVGPRPKPVDSNPHPVRSDCSAPGGRGGCGSRPR